MARFLNQHSDKVIMPIAPMIDCVFLMLIYFLLTASLEKQEADISFTLPGRLQQKEVVEMPCEQLIKIDSNGQIYVNEYRYDSPDSVRYIELAALLSRFKEECHGNHTECYVNIQPDPVVTHQTIIKVMDAIAVAGVDSVNFSDISE